VVAPWRSWIAANIRPHRKLYVGLSDQTLHDAIAKKQDFVYIDHGYWNRGYSFRVIVGETHLTKLLDRPGDRISTNPVGGNTTTPQIAPWKKWHDGRGHVVVIPPSEVVSGVFRIPGGPRGWMDNMTATLRKYTAREIKFKKEKSPPLAEYCDNCHAVVTFGSVAGVEAALLGYPVFSGPICPTLPISAGTLETIDKPVYSDNREAWVRSLSYAQYTFDELEKMNLDEYEYRCA
jgi:hypothetical protein